VHTRQALLNDANAIADVLSDEKQALLRQLSQCASDGALNARLEEPTRACLCKHCRELRTRALPSHPPG